MGTISTHMGENLMPTDRGISLYRRRIRRQIKELADGAAPPQPHKGQSVHTYGQDTVLHLPAGPMKAMTGRSSKRSAKRLWKSNLTHEGRGRCGAG